MLLSLTLFSMVYMSFGTNLGDRLHNLTLAIQRCEEAGFELINVSSVYETPPWGFDAETSFYNCVASFDVFVDAEKLLQLTQQIEREMGRTAKTSGNYVSRIIDIDLLFIDKKVINKDELVVPHQKMAERKFVLVPLSELNPLFIHPLREITVQTMLHQCLDDSPIELVVTNIDFAKKICRASGERKK